VERDSLPVAAIAASEAIATLGGVLRDCCNCSDRGIAK